MKKIRIGIKRESKMLPNMGVFVIPVPEKAANILVLGFAVMRNQLEDAGYKDLARQLVCEWR